MKRKYLAAGLGVLVLTGMAFLMKAYSGGEAAQEGRGVSASSLAAPLNSFLRLSSKLSLPIGNGEVKQIRKLDFPECQDLDKDPGIQECYRRLEKEASWVAEQRDPNRVPDLIKLAQQKKFKSPKDFKGEEEHIEYKYRVCRLRFAAIGALGEIKDPRAVAPLLELMNESYTKAHGCPVAGDNEIDTLCGVAGKSLLKLKPQGVTDKLLSNLENHKFNYSTMFLGVSEKGSYEEMNTRTADATIYRLGVRASHET